MPRIPIYGKVERDRIKSEVDFGYDDYYRFALILLREGVVTYDDITKMEDEEVYRWAYALSLLQDEEKKELEKIKKEAQNGRS